jgi:hypothetical protein
MRERPREARDAHADTDTNTLYTISRVCARRAYTGYTQWGSQQSCKLVWCVHTRAYRSQPGHTGT